MRVLIYGVAPWLKTGYGNTTRMLLTHLGEVFDVDVATYFGLSGSTLSFGESKIIPVYGWLDKSSTEHLKVIVKDNNPDVVLQHFDIWTLPPGWASKYDKPVVSYSPIDCIPMPVETVNATRGVHTAVGMTRYATDMYREAGINSIYIPHAYDESIFFPIPRNEARARIGLPEDTFILGQVGTNRSVRKNITGQLKAYADALKLCPAMKEDSLFFLHCYMDRSDLNMEGLDLLAYIAQLGIEENIRYTNQDQYISGLPDEMQAIMMNSFDILMSCSMGEGFCIPIAEAAACGVPCITTNFSAMPEVAGPGGVLVEPGEHLFLNRINAYHAMPSVGQITDWIIELYKNRGKVQALGQAAIAHSKQYQRKVVIPKWIRLLSKFA